MNDQRKSCDCVRSQPNGTVVAEMSENGFVHYWTVNVTDGGLAVSGPGAGIDWIEQKLSRFWNAKMQLGLYTMEYYINGELKRYSLLADVERHWGGVWVPERQEAVDAVPE